MPRVLFRRSLPRAGWAGAAVLLVAAAACQQPLNAPRADPAPVRGTFLWDYHNRPRAALLAGAEYAVLSPRGLLAPGVADTLERAGTKPVILFQPVLAVVGPAGPPVEGREFPWDTRLLGLARRHAAVLLDAAGAPVNLFPSDPRYAAFVLDLRDTAFVDSLALVLADQFPRARGVDFDYGCGDLAWADLPRVDPAIWPVWRAGFLRLLGRVRAARPDWVLYAQCDRWPEGMETLVDGLFLEQLGMSLAPPAKAWAQVTRLSGRRNFLRVEGLGARNRRLFAGIALLTDGVFNQCDLRGDYGGGSDRNARDLEHWTLSLGEPAGPWSARARDVYGREFARGLVVVNLGAQPYLMDAPAGESHVVGGLDALVAQTRDAGGQPIPWITNEGR